MDTTTSNTAALLLEQYENLYTLRNKSDRNLKVLTEKMDLTADLITEYRRLVNIEFYRKQTILDIANLLQLEADMMDEDPETEPGRLNIEDGGQEVLDTETKAGKVKQVARLQQNAWEVARASWEAKHDQLKLQEVYSRELAEYQEEKRCQIQLDVEWSTLVFEERKREKMMAETGGHVEAEGRPAVVNVSKRVYHAMKLAMLRSTQEAPKETENESEEERAERMIGEAKHRLDEPDQTMEHKTELKRWIRTSPRVRRAGCRGAKRH